MVSGYTAVYGGEDLAEAGIDFGGAFLVEMVNQSGILAEMFVAFVILGAVLGLMLIVFALLGVAGVLTLNWVNTGEFFPKFK